MITFLKIKPFCFTLLALGLLLPAAYANDTHKRLSKTERLRKIQTQLQLAKKKLRMNSQLSMAAAKEVRQLAPGFDETANAEAGLLIAQIYLRKGKTDTALVLIKTALEASKKLQNDTLQAEAYHSLGLNYQFKGSIELAIESYHQALEINESVGAYKASMKQLNNIGLLHREEGNYALALEYMEKCLRVSREKGFKRFELYSYGNIGYILMKQNRWEEALERLEKTLELSHLMKDTVSFCTINYLISDVKLNQKDLPAAKDFARRALKVANHVDYAVGKVFSQRVLSDAYRLEKKFNRARKIIEETVNFVEENSIELYIEDVLQAWYAIEYETGNYKKALGIQKRIFTRRDSLAQIETKEKISNSEYKHQLMQNEQENQLLKIQNGSSRRTAVLAVMIAFLLLLLVFLAYVAYRKSKDYSVILEKAIDERTKELEDSNSNLAKSNKELERFAFIASHDLKTPLRDIVSFTGLLERRLKNHEDKSVHEYLDFIKQGGIRLNNLIMDTLEYSRLSHLGKESKVVPIDLNLLMEELRNFMSKSMTERNARLVVPQPLPKIMANHSSLVLLFQNLISNSFKYNESERPTVKVYTRVQPTTVSIFVEDNGIGIPEEYYEEIFVMFARLHTQNQYEGSGLGLAICKKVIEQLNGEIRVKSEKAKGSTFEIILSRAFVVEETMELKDSSMLN